MRVEVVLFLLSMIGHSLCDKIMIHALNQTGTLSAENRVVDSSRMVIFTCQTICGKLQWHLNGRIVSEGSQNELYKVTQVYSTCSASFSPQCVQCGCNNCHDIQYQSSQTYTSNISITVYGNFVLSCMSILSYPHQQYTVLRKTYNVDVAHESIHSTSLIIENSHPTPTSSPSLLISTNQLPTTTITTSLSPPITHTTASPSSVITIEQNNITPGDVTVLLAIVTAIMLAIMLILMTVIFVICIVVKRRKLYS